MAPTALGFYVTTALLIAGTLALWYAAFTRSGLDAIDPAGGKVLFQFPWRSRMDASVNAATPLVIHDGNVVERRAEIVRHVSKDYGKVVAWPLRDFEVITPAVRMLLAFGVGRAGRTVRVLLDIQSGL